MTPCVNSVHLFKKNLEKSQTKIQFKIHTAHTESVLLIISLCGIFSTVKKKENNTEVQSVKGRVFTACPAYTVLVNLQRHLGLCSLLKEINAIH